MAAPEPQQVGFIGLGAMGLGMARQLLAAGFAVRGFDLDRNACAAFASSGGTVCRSVAEAAAGCTLLFVVVFTAAQAREVLFGDDGAAAALAPGATVSNHATTSPAQAQELEAVSAAVPGTMNVRSNNRTLAYNRKSCSWGSPLSY